MVSAPLASRYNPLALGRRVRRMLRTPSDLPLALQLAYFIWRVPGQLERMPLPKLLEALRAAPRPTSISTEAGVERVNRLSRPWFRLPPLRNRNTCYVRALMFYRFLDPQAAPMQIHFLVEPGRQPGERLRGHAWVTIGQTLIEPPPAEVVARTRRIYVYPEAGKAEQ